MFVATIVGLCVVVWQQQVTISELHRISGRVDRLEIQCNCTDTSAVDRDQGNRPDNELRAGDLLGSISEQLSNVKSEVKGVKNNVSALKQVQEMHINSTNQAHINISIRLTQSHDS